MTLLLGFGAVNTGNNLLYLLVSALLGFMAISGLLGHWNLKNLQVALEPPDEIYAGLETLMRVRLYNGHRLLPVFLLDVYFDVQSSRIGHLSLLKKRQREPVSVPVTFSARGEQQCQLLTISSSFPINFFVRRRILELSQNVIVFPRPLMCRQHETTNRTQSPGMLETQAKGTDGDISRIGNYQGTEPLKMIHWKLSARHDSLKIKELSNPQHPPVQIDLLTLPGAGLEQQLRCAAFLINDLSRRNQPVGLKMGEVTLPSALGLGHKLRLLKELAIYAQD
ncbi:MAG: DUF58 domain-containing protein [Desulfuromonadaceae bacterium]|nr:DUF58 domain-containing protein [Desulfuromonadaceae bacterium]